MRNHRFTNFVLVFFVLPTVFLMVGCGQERDRAILANVTPPPSVKVVILLDKTGSSARHGVPNADSLAIAPLLELMTDVGGELAVGTIESVSENPLLRIRIEVPPIAPIDSSDLMPNVFLEAKVKAAYQKEMVSYTETLAQWKRSRDPSIKAFWLTLDSMISRPADQRATDIYNAVMRANTFLLESDASWNDSPLKYAILCSDGEHNSSSQPAIRPADGVEYLLVPGAREGCLAALKPVRFESLPAAIRYILANHQAMSMTEMSTQKGG